MQAVYEAEMEQQQNIFLKKTFVAITGASKGLGRCIALQFAAKFPANTVFVLMARNEQALENVKSEIVSKTPNVTVLVRQYDQGIVEKGYFNDIFNEILLRNNLSENDFQQFMIVHNCAAVIGLSKKTLELCDSVEVRNAFDINLIGMILLNTSFFQTFSDSKKSRVVVNMSSAAASTPVRYMHLYCAVADDGEPTADSANSQNKSHLIPRNKKHNLTLLIYVFLIKLLTSPLIN